MFITEWEKYIKIITKMEESFKDFILEFTKKYNSMVTISLNRDEIVISNLDWNGRTLTFKWGENLIEVFRTLMEDRYAYTSPTDIYGM